MTETFSPTFESTEPELTMWSTYLYEEQAHPGMLTREVRDYTRRYVDGVDNRGEAVDKIREALLISKGLFDDLQDTYGIKSVGFTPAIGNSPLDGQLVGLVRSRIIEGQGYRAPEVGNDVDVDERLKSIVIAPEHKPAAKTLLDKLTPYFVDNSRGDQDFLDDVFSIDQYVYTPPTAEAPEGEFILVDMDPPEVDRGEVEGSFFHAEKMIHLLAEKVLEPEELAAWNQQLKQDLAEAAKI